MKGGAKYFTHVKTFTKQNVTSEYLSTDFTFTKLEKAIDTYNGWRKQTFTECNDFMMTSPRVDFDFENADSVYKNNILFSSEYVFSQKKILQKAHKRQ